MTAAALALGFLGGALAGLGAALLLPAGRRGGRRAERLVRALAAAGARLGPARGPAVGDLEARLLAAGRPGGLDARDLLAAKLAAAAGCGAGAPLIAALAPGRLGILMVAAAPVAGFLAPDLWLHRLVERRAEQVRRELPAMLDLLRVAVDAGASLPAALGAVGERADGPLAREWRAAAREVGLGVPLGEALADLKRRLPQPEVAALVAALDRARRHGAPLGDTLAGQAKGARLARARRAREEAARAGPKIQLVVALLLVPSVLLLVAAALASALLNSGGAALPV